MKQRTHLSNKLKQYFEDSGVKRRWMAKKMDMSEVQFLSVTKGNIALPMKYWRTLIEITSGYITVFDLIKDKFESIHDELEFKIGKNFNECIVSLKDLKDKRVKEDFNCEK